MENQVLKGNYYLMQIESEYIATRSRPGNFVMVAVSSTHEPLLKRPFGIFSSKPPHIWLYYQVVGTGTELMAKMKPGDEVNVLGPLGNSFPDLKGKNILLIAGGRGIAPLYFAAENYALENQLSLIYGAGSSGDLNLLPRIEALDIKKTHLYTEDGSLGKKGFVTENIREIISDEKIEVTVSCGPDAMFESLDREIGDLGTMNYASLEAMMGCGFGICYSCAVRVKAGGYKKVCTDGPVFNMEDIEW